MKRQPFKDALLMALTTLILADYPYIILQWCGIIESTMFDDPFYYIVFLILDTIFISYLTYLKIRRIKGKKQKKIGKNGKMI